MKNNYISSGDLDITPEGLTRALENLPTEQQTIIENLAAELIDKIKAQSLESFRRQGLDRKSVMLSRVNALEILAKIGIFMVRKEIPNA
jgi:hypothetical protein